MAFPTVREPRLLADVRASLSPPGFAAIPDARGASVLTFVFVALAEYWIAPALFGVTNYAGAWSAVGYLLFLVFVTTMVVYLVLPLRARLRAADLTIAERRLFQGLGATSLLVALFATRSVFADQVLGARPAGLSASVATVYTPFGAWPSLVLDDPALGVAASFNVVLLTVLGLLAVVWSAAFVLELAKRRHACAIGSASGPARGSRWAAAAVWGPLGFVSGCASCSPMYLALLGMAAPASASEGYAFLPLVPWIGLSGLLEILSLALALAVLHRVTATPAAIPEYREPSDEVPAP